MKTHGKSKSSHSNLFLKMSKFSSIIYQYLIKIGWGEVLQSCNLQKSAEFGEKTMSHNKCTWSIVGGQSDVFLVI